MKFKRLDIVDVIEITPKIFKDKRGFFCETFRLNKFKKILKLKNLNFVQDNLSKSKKHTLRGLHFQIENTQDKLISVLDGEIFDVAVDLRKNSKTFGKTYNCILSEKNSKSIFIPEGFAHGFQGLDKENYIIYSCTKYRDKNNEVAINVNDKNFNIKWPSKKKIISKKDQRGITFHKYKEMYL